MSVIVTLTTIPSRLAYRKDVGVLACLNSLIDQDTLIDYEIHMNIPKISNRTGEHYIIPEWLTELSVENPKLKLFTDLEDYGSITKLIPTVQRISDPNTIIIVCDDDLIYHPKMVEVQVENQSKYENTCIGYDGVRGDSPLLGDIRDHFVVSLPFPLTQTVNYLQHYKTISYKRSFFDDDLLSDEFLGQSWADDIVLGAYMTKRGITKLVASYEHETKIETLEQWQSRGGVTTFPVLAHTHHESLEGCNLNRHDKEDDNFMYFVKKGYLK
jgi:hypothetical protein